MAMKKEDLSENMVIGKKDKGSELRKINELPGYKTSIKEQDYRKSSYQEFNSISNEDGTSATTEYTTIKRVKEGDFIKLYLEDIGYIYNLQESQHVILYHLLRRMGYDGLIVVNKTIKEIIAKDTDKALSTVNNALSAYTKAGILIREGRGVYLANPYLFGRGKFEDIQKIRMQLEYTPEGIKLKSSIQKG